MEHRNGSRIPAQLNVSIWAGNTHMGWFRTTNVSPGGLAVRGRIQGLATNSLIRAILEVLGEGEPRYVELRALVVHQSDSSVGLMWATETAGLAELGLCMEQLAA